MREIGIQENSKVFALSMVLLNTLILFAVVGIFGLVQMFLTQINQLNAILNGFRS